MKSDCEIANPRIADRKNALFAQVYELLKKCPAVLDLGIVVLVSIPAVLPLMASGYLQGADAVDAPWRSLALRESLKEGILFPRWVGDQFCRYGFPTFNFYAPLSFYPAVLLDIILGTDLVEATKATFGIFVMFMGVGAYLLSRCFFDNRAIALLASTLFIYSPSNLIAVYVGSGLAGLAGLALLPFVMAVFLRMNQAPGTAICGVAALSVLLMVLTHNVTAVVAFGTIVALTVAYVFQKRDRRALSFSMLALSFGIVGSAFFWMPAILEFGFTHTEKPSIGQGHYVYHLVNLIGNVDVGQLAIFGLSPDDYKMTRWGLFDLNLAYPYGSFPYKPGLFQGLLLLLIGFAFIVRKTKGTVALFLFLSAILCLFIHTTLSRPLWETKLFMSVFQFPYRFDGLLSLSLAVLGPWSIYILFRRHPMVWMLMFGGATIVSSLWNLPAGMGPFAQGLAPTRDDLLKYEHRESNRLGSYDGHFLPQSVQWDTETIDQGDVIRQYDQVFPPERWVDEAAFLSPESKAWIVAARRGQQWMEILVDAGEATMISFHTIYFPGWTAYIDSQKVAVEPSAWQVLDEGRKVALGVCQVVVPEGRHLVRLVFEDTPVRLLAKVISALGILGIGSLFVVAFWRRGKVVRSGKQLVVLLLIWVLVAGGSYGAYRGFVSSRAAEVAWVENRVVRDFVKGAEVRSLRLDAPLGAKADDYVHPRVFTIGGESRPVVYMHPTSSAGTRVWLPKGAKLEFGMGVDPAVWDKAGDGVEFEVLVREGDGTERVFSRYIDPKGNPADRRWVVESIELARYAHREVEVVLRTQPGATGEFDWAGWAEPRITIP